MMKKEYMSPNFENETVTADIIAASTIGDVEMNGSDLGWANEASLLWDK